jgi:hypothetical protein
VSEVFAINSNLQAVGTSSVSASTFITDSIDACNSDEVTTDIEVCLYQARTLSRERHTRRATVWQLDAQGETISTETFGLSFTPEADDTFNYVNEAVDINTQGIAVGNGQVLGEFSVRNLAMLYQNSQTRQLLPEDVELEGETGGSFAIGINDDGLIAGYQAQAINGAGVAKMFVYNLNDDSFEFFPGFFRSSNTFPRDINNNGIIVGDAEIEVAQGTRPRAAFRFDTATNEFIDLNTLLACDSPLQLISAVGINDNNEIIADAVVLDELRSVTGEVLVDSAGEPLLTQSRVVTVKLTPNNQPVPDCSADDGTDDPDNLERKGASNSAWFLLFVLSILGFRRFK